MSVPIPILVGISGLIGYLMADQTDPHQLSNLTELRNPESLPADTRQMIDLITIQKDIKPVGSQKFKIQKYPSDIDLFEKYQTCCDLPTAKIKIVRELQKIAKRIQQSKVVYFGDFKAGRDDRYLIDLGQVNYLNHTIIGFNATKLANQISTLLKSKLLTSDEYVEIIHLIHQPINIPNQEQLVDIFKSKQSIRWTLNEIIKGEKILIGGLKLTLGDAIAHDAIVKLDVWGQIQGGRFTEITNFMIFTYVDTSGQTYPVNIRLGNLIESFMKDIILYSSQEHRKSMKLAKRIWQLSTYLDDVEMLQKITPLLQSEIGIPNQIASDIEVLKLMLNKVTNPPLELIIKEIDEFKSRLSSFQEISLDEKLINLLIDEIRENYTKYGKNYDQKLMIANLTYLETYLQGIVEILASEYLQTNRINIQRLIQRLQIEIKKVKV